MKTYLFTSIILLHFLNLNGQSISGTVQDEKTGEAIPFANVSLWKKDSTVFQGTLSDPLGKFSFKKIPGNIAYVKVQALNYQSFNQSINVSNVLLDIRLKPENTFLNEVIVKG